MKGEISRPSISEREGHRKAESVSLMERLKAAETKEEKQAVLNELFPLERREQMIEGASEDLDGHKVVYYRRMLEEDLIKLIESGQQTPESYCDPEETIDLEKELSYFVNRYYRKMAFEADKTITRMKIEASFESKPLRDRLLILFPDAELEIEYLLHNPIRGNLLSFIKNHIDDDYIKKVHTGSLDQKFSPFLSASVGGTYSDLMYSRRVLVEMVAPDNKVIPHPQGVEGEKEVFFKKIDSTWITRVIIVNDQFYQEVLGDDRTSLGSFASRHKQGSGFYDIDVIERWRWDTKTNNCLPARLNAA